MSRHIHVSDLMTANSLAKARLHLIDGEAEEVTEHALAEVSQTNQPKLTWWSSLHHALGLGPALEVLDSTIERKSEPSG